MVISYREVAAFNLEKILLDDIPNFRPVLCMVGLQLDHVIYFLNINSISFLVEDFSFLFFSSTHMGL